MPLKTEKNVLKQYFRSGSRPNQRQFQELIDNCYNEAFSCFVPGYGLLTDTEKNQTIRTIKREGGKTVLVPFFDRINITHHRVYHYAIPVSNLGAGLVLDKIMLEINLPRNGKYSVQDRSRKVQITQTVNLDTISVFNGTKEIYSSSGPIKGRGSSREIMINKSADHWMGIGIDIVIRYDITSDIAVSDQLDITLENEQMLEHTFGGAGCIFIQNN